MPTKLSKGFRLLPAPFCVTLDLFLGKKAFAAGAGETRRCFQREPGLPESQGASSLAAQVCHYRAARAALRLRKPGGATETLTQQKDARPGEAAAAYP